MSRDDQLTASPESIASEVASFAKEIDFGAESKTVDDLDDSLMIPNGIHDEDDVGEGFFGAQAADGEAGASEQAAPEVKPSQTIKFKANGKDIELSHEEAQKRLSLAEGARQALADRAKLRKEVAAKDKSIQEMSRYKDSWDKLESIKHDKKQLLELLTGENYDDLMRREAEKREIHQYGSEEQKQMLQYAEELETLKRSRELETAAQKRESERAEQLAFDAEKQRVQTAMEREYFKHDMPADIDQAEQEVLKDMLWNKSARDLRKYHEKYGKITNKMVEKAFSDNAAVLFRTKSAQVDKTVQKLRADESKAAKEKAQIASTRQSDAGSTEDLSKLDPKQLFNHFFKR